MKADFTAMMYPMIAIILFIVVITVYFLFYNTQKITSSSYDVPQEKIICSVKSDCDGKNEGFLCLSINQQATFCGCLDDNDCKATLHCVYNKCRS